MEDNDNVNNEVSKTIQYRSRTIQTTARRIFSNRHVYLLSVPQNPISAWLPGFLCPWLKWFLPEWFMPSKVILKERNTQKADEFDNEIETYKRLQSLQGYCIPVMFGEAASCKTSHVHISNRPAPAILLQNVQGVPLHELPVEQLEDPSLLKELESAYTSFTENGIVHGDPELHNFLRDTNGRVFAIDLELSHLPIHVTNEHELETLKDRIQELIAGIKGDGRHRMKAR
ncbi:hypothetical protein QBC35DRAFT_444889 [Podospora australis]|uniref:Protein kinase domain-containing protein n=1 Tax=Podospora australis TaxID=1536484 RepID=A0AAN6WIW7_9PEZI|nr:hypothetical protein QBC35DRAFT_444889 [Podospora australis]